MASCSHDGDPGVPKNGPRRCVPIPAYGVVGDECWGVRVCGEGLFVRWKCSLVKRNEWKARAAPRTNFNISAKVKPVNLTHRRRHRHCHRLRRCFRRWMTVTGYVPALSPTVVHARQISIVLVSVLVPVCVTFHVAPQESVPPSLVC